MISESLDELLISANAGYWGVEPNGSDVDVLVVRNGDIKPGRGVRWLDLPQRGFREAEAAKSKLLKEDLLLTTSGDCGVVAMVEESPEQTTCASNFIRVLRVDRDKAHPRYLFHYMQTAGFRRALQPFIRGTTMKNLSVKQALPTVRIPLPATPEQRRIAEILDRAEALRACRSRSLAHLDELSRSVYSSMFGSYGSHLQGSERVPLGDALKLRSGAFLPAKDQKPGPYPVYGGNGINGYHETYMFEEPRLVVGRVGAYCGVVHLTPERSWVTDNALYVSEMRREFSLEYLLHALTVANLNQFASRSGQPLISGGRIKDVPIVVPTPAAQEVFASRIGRLNVMKGLMLQAQNVESSMMASLRSRAFSGRL
ncbi:restriction endonuclease subunit S [Geodermatophilus sp. SYSU D00691]